MARVTLDLLGAIDFDFPANKVLQVTARKTPDLGILAKGKSYEASYSDGWGRVATDPTECTRLVKDLGDKPVMLLRNHGGITTGKTVCEAFIASFYLEKACQFQILAQSAGMPMAMPSDEIIAASGGRPPGDERAWPSLLRMLDREDPSYRD